MAAFFDYIRNITYYLLFAALVNMAAPGGKYKKYVALVTGLILVCLILHPLTTLLDGGLPVTELYARIVPVPSSGGGDTAHYEAWQYETLKTAFEDQLSAQLSALLAQNGYVMEDASFVYTDDFSQMQQITVTATREGKARAKPFIYIEPVRIGKGTTEAESHEAETVKKLISDFYKLGAEHIDVSIRTQG